MIVRISGADAHAIARKLAPNLSDRGSSAGLHRMSLDQMEKVEFPAWVYYFRGPYSYTGEDLVELHIPGNAVLARMVLERVMALGAREAQAGEFTARAYFSRRMGLSQAEGVAATIAASNEQELRAARQLMSGELARRLRPVMDLVAETLALVEAGIDFSDQDVSFLGAEDGRARLNKALAMLRELVNQSARFERLSHEPTIVLVGRPNAGKSTLLNALAGSERAVVSNIAGTTRDVLSAEVRLSRGLVRVADVAGLEEAPVSGDSIAAQMQSRARQALETADHVVLVHEATDREAPIVVDRAVDLVVRTKGDLVNAHVEGEFIVSAKTGQGMDELRERLDRMAFRSSAAGSALALNARHLAAIAEAEEALVRGRDVVGPAGLEILALELREALDELGRVLGEMSPDDVLGRVFATFCIGK